MTFDEFARIVAVAASGVPGDALRRGQNAMGTLRRLDDAAYRDVTGKRGVDPFYRDSLLPAFLSYLLLNHVTPPRDCDEPQASGITKPEAANQARRSRLQWSSAIDGWKQVCD